MSEKLCNPMISLGRSRSNCFPSKSPLHMMSFATKTIIIRMSRRPLAVAANTSSLNAPSESKLSYWNDYFFNYFHDENMATQDDRERQVELKEQVRKELLETVSSKPITEQLQLIDDILRLGVGYHFEDEIEEALNQIHQTYQHLHRDLDLYHASLMFRLLRRHGFYVSTDTFKQFLDESEALKASWCSDLDGILSLYEASHLRIHGDDILDEALRFTTTRLKSMLSTSAQPVAAKAARALKQPLHKGFGRLEARYYISFYEQNPDHNKLLLQFAKLDFNLLQLLHKKEIGDLTRWCCNLDFYKHIPWNVRQLPVELYYCAMASLDERPQYAFGRMIYVKVCALWTILDDLYDVCDITLLELLTEAIERWDRGYVGLEKLPGYLKVHFNKLLDVFDELEQQLAKDGRSYALSHAMEAFKDAFQCNLVASKWCRDEYVPTYDEYISKTGRTIGSFFCTILCYICLGEVTTKEVLEWARKFPNVIEAFCTIARLEDDIAEDDPMEREATEKPCAISCYMKQYNVNKDEAYQGLQNVLDDAWKGINQAMLRLTVVPMPVLERMLTQSQLCYNIYQGGDGFTDSYKTQMKENIALIFKDPVPV